MPEHGRPCSSEHAGNGPTLAEVDILYRTQSRRVLATLIRLLGDFELAEEALHDAFIAAVQQWPRDGLPSNPRAWLVSTGRFKAIDGLRRRARFDASLSLLADQLDGRDEPEWEREDLEDDRLRLIFTCCHPTLPADAQVALTLREVCDLKTEEIARAFLASPSTIAQRIVRAKQKIREAGIPYRVPTRDELPARLDNVLRVIYLVFNEGYSASSGRELTRADLSAEAIRLGHLLLELLPDPELMGLLALMLLHDSRRAARTDEAGELVRLDEQDRSRWSQAQIAEGAALVERALASRRFGPYTVQAAIVAVHAKASSAAQTDWAQIVALYDLLLRISPSPVIELNRAVALAMRDGAEVGLAAIDRLLARGELRDYHLLHSARADFCRRLGRLDEAREAYRAALGLAQLEPEKRFLQQRLDELDAGQREA
ncbi:RNA polymerase sigma factor [Stutzerimonas xanthomarina]|uniref:RNA polymerase, sigma subunit, ECF family n=2 Tax=Stutzerimonas xanthomarina TaxID=271420 RepID=A0A1M5TKX3_9GAMM|nr:RNA polymerase sigma factor [Stutzerimonas xanthomarina]MCP9339989.1 RNA polymerase sigma factor [Stutzerimonas xanthomarina]SEH55838.1 RNA polymerase sigma-70 factor, ECF subfamily [Stutzerimonas xanthomarina]SHH51455.1 RNA polymerase, sigma subunit, ECF family [Stutzerimonas xanthomarina DSM 18231]